jgi:hypothetical protein
MACITWELPSGERYLVAEHANHIPPAGAFNTGVVDWTCTGGTQQNEVDAMLEKAGIKWGTAIKRVTSWIGLKQCSGCKAREVILNKSRELGWAETLRQLKDTL